jgi:hypothetical protein
MPAIGRVKLKTLAPVGGVSYIVMVRFAVPGPQFVTQPPPLFKPLQEERMAAEQMARRLRYNVERIGAPRNNF